MLVRYKHNNLVRYGVVNSQGIPNEEVKKFLEHKRNVELLSNSTITAYASDLSLFVDYMEKENITLEDINIDVLVNFRSYLLKTPIEKTGKYRSEKTINRYIKTIISFYRYLSTYGSIEFNINQYLKKDINNLNNSIGILSGIATRSKFTSNLLTIPEREFNEKILTGEELKLILECCNNKRDKLIIRVLVETGIRIGELLHLNIEDIDVANTSIYIRDRRYEDGGYRLKTISSERQIPISKSLLNDLMSYIRESYSEIDSNYIFNKVKGPNKGERLDYISIHALFKRLRHKSKIDRLHPHLIRKTTITTWILGGMNKIVVKTLAGHKSIETTEKYYVYVSILKMRKEVDIYERKKLLNE